MLVQMENFLYGAFWLTNVKRESQENNKVQVKRLVLITEIWFLKKSDEKERDSEKNEWTNVVVEMYLQKGIVQTDSCRETKLFRLWNIKTQFIFKSHSRRESFKRKYSGEDLYSIYFLKRCSVRLFCANYRTLKEAARDM